MSGKVSILIERTGLFDTLQDSGRTGFRSFGVPNGGWFDSFHAQLANALAGNDFTASCLEVTQMSGKFLAELPLHVAVVGPGAEIAIQRNSGASQRFHHGMATLLQPGDCLETQHPSFGFRSYVAVAGGGWKSKNVLGSVSQETRLVAGERLFAMSPQSSTIPRNTKRIKTGPLQFELTQDKPLLRFVPSGAFDFLSAHMGCLQEILNDWKALPQSNRIGVRFEPIQVPPSDWFGSLDPNRLSQPVLPGTIQWTGSQWIILGVASGTMGGYPTVGKIIGVDMKTLAQIRPGQSVGLVPVEISDARSIAALQDHNQSRFLARIRLGSNL